MQGNKQVRRVISACVASIFAFSTLGIAVPAHADSDHAKDDGANTATPIKHVIIIVGENRSYDHLFATYAPKKGSTVNLLSEGIVNADGSAGPNVGLAAQMRGEDLTTFSISPDIKGSYKTLPPPTTGFVHQSPSDTNPPPFATIEAAGAADHDVPENDLVELTTGATGLPFKAPDTRIPNAENLPNQPFELTGLYDAYMNSPVHRFFQSWQVIDVQRERVHEGPDITGNLGW